MYSDSISIPRKFDSGILMQYVYYTLLAVILYFLSDWLVGKIEQVRGETFKQQRSTVFFVIIMILSVSTFKAIELLVNN